MSAFTLRVASLGSGRSLGRRFARAALAGLGWAFIFIGFVGTILPGHLGLPFLVVGLIVVLRSSFQARRRFVDLQHRHPRLLFPVRRLLRREPEIFPVAWQQLLRFERLILPRRFRVARRVRRGLRQKFG
ncbi:MAG: hypothetical protein JO111_05900 [Caulobacteraceae bacterium]|nr:hypothetical protein [Caulobacteraceae bacterium]